MAEQKHTPTVAMDLLKACEAALDLPRICEEIGYAGEHDCLLDGHAMIKTKNGDYVKSHAYGGLPERDRIIVMLQVAIAKMGETEW